MDRDYKVLGQAISVLATDISLYQVPAGKYAVISTLAMVNRNKTGDAIEYRIAVVPEGETLSDKHYIEYDDFIDVRESRRLTIGISIGAGTKVFVRGSLAGVSFSLFGVEVTIT